MLIWLALSMQMRSRDLSSLKAVTLKWEKNFLVALIFLWLQNFKVNRNIIFILGNVKILKRRALIKKIVYLEIKVTTYCWQKQFWSSLYCNLFCTDPVEYKTSTINFSKLLSMVFQRFPLVFLKILLLRPRQ